MRVLGTPAEEGGGGKIIMLERGGFDGVNAAMMVHPAPSELDRMPCLAVAHFDVRYTGKEAHASAYPDRGVNAADAITVAQVAIGLLRQHSRPNDQVHGIVTYGGAAPNIVPALAVARFYVRAETLEDLKIWEPRVDDGASRRGRWRPAPRSRSSPTAPRIPSSSPTSPWQRSTVRNAEAAGRVFPTGPERALKALSTDMGNVSLAIPSIHPMLGIDSLPAVNHQPEFAAAAASPAADRAVLEGALAMAWTTIDLASDEVQRGRLGSMAYHHA